MENETHTHEHHEPVHHQEGGKSASKFSTPGAIIAAGLIIALAIIFTHYAPTAGTGATNNGQQAAKAVDIKKVKIADNPFIGDKNAPVTIAYWSDYQCPFCKQFETTALARLKADYIDAGKVKVVFKDFQFLGEDSTTAALYSHAVWGLYPDKYFEWREAMFAKQDDEGDQGFGDEASIKEVTGTIAGIDVTTVSNEVTKNKAKYMKIIDADKEEGASFGVSGTPSLIVDKTLFPGVPSYEKIAQTVDAALK